MPQDAPLWRRVTATRWERRGTEGRCQAAVWCEQGRWHGHGVLRGRIVPLLTRRGHNRRFRSSLHAIREVGSAFPFEPADTGAAGRDRCPHQQEV